MKLSLKGKMIGGFLAVAVIAALIGLIGYRGMLQAKAAQDEVAGVRLPSVYGLGIMNASLSDMGRAERTLVTPGISKEELDQQFKDIKEFNSAYEKGVKIYEPLPQSKEEEATWKEYKSAYDAWKKDHEQVVSLVEQGKREEAHAVAYGAATKDYQKASGLVDKLLEINMKLATDTDKEFDGEFKTTNMLSIGSVILGVVVSLLFGFFLSSSISGALSRVSESLTEGSHQVTSASTQLSATAQGMAEGSSEQAASLEETSSAMEEMSAMTRQNAENAGQAKTLSGQMGKSVDKANGSMVSMVTAMDQISQRSEEIGKIIKTIDEIAFQTNLLALNAAVEAARAGEAGAGFAVVADEVRNLAQRAAAAAKNTSDLIESTISVVGAGTQLVQETNKDFSEVSVAVRKVTELIGEISAASSEQARGITEVSTAISQMDKVTQTNAAGSEEIAASSEELSSQAISLTEIVATLQGIITGENGGGIPAASAPAASRRRPAAPPARSLSARSPGSGRVANRMALKKATRQYSPAEEAIPFDEMGEF